MIIVLCYVMYHICSILIKQLSFATYLNKRYMASIKLNEGIYFPQPATYLKAVTPKHCCPAPLRQPAC